MKSYFWGRVSSSLLIVFISVGCASILGPFAPEDAPYGFNSPSLPPASVNPLPIEIAKDIEAISEDGVIFYQNPKIQVGQPPLSASEQLDPISDEVEKEFVLGGGAGPLATQLKADKSGPLGAVKKLRVLRTVAAQGGKTVTYVVKKGDTLMEIAFDKHGNYLRWRDIYNTNRKKMTHWRNMKVGTVLSVRNVKYVYIKKNGKPYLIRKGDTLKVIAKKLYGSPLMWKKIWKNNPQLIRNPKKIYAGFTLFAPEKASRLQQKLRKPSQAN